MAEEHNKKLDESDEPTSAASDDETPSSFVSIFGPHKKRRKLRQSRAEYLLDNLHEIDDSWRNLFPSGVDAITAGSDDLDLHHEGVAVADSSPSSVSKSTPPSQSVASEATSAPSITPRAFGKLSIPGRASKSDPATIKGMKIFNQEIDEAVYQQFREVSGKLEEALVEYLHKRHVAFRPLALQVLVLGATVDVAKPWIVVNCPKEAKKKTKSFIKQGFVKSWCYGDSSCRVRFEIVVGKPLKPSDTTNLDEVFVKEESMGARCFGAPQIKVIQSGISHYATMGGFVCVTDGEGKKAWYGLTAGHVLPADDYDGESTSSDIEKVVDEEGTDTENGSDTDTDGHVSDAGSVVDADHWALVLQRNRKRSLRSYNTDDDASEEDRARDGPSWSSLGSMAEVSYSTRARNRDWALVNVNEAYQKRLSTTTGTSSALLEAGYPERYSIVRKSQFETAKTTSKALLEDARPADDQHAIVGNGAMTTCAMSPRPARAILPSGHVFVDVYVLQLPQHIVLPEGSSGSWIIGSNQESSTTVYGALAATDSLGSLWMVPIIDILRDIKEETKAVAVKLSNAIEAASASNKVENTTSTAKGTNASQHNKLSGVKDGTMGIQQSQSPYAPITPLYANPRTISIPIESPYASRSVPTGPHHIFQEVPSNHSKINRKSSYVWFCGECGDGPTGDWQISCPICGHNGGR